MKAGDGRISAGAIERFAAGGGRQLDTRKSFRGRGPFAGLQNHAPDAAPREGRMRVHRAHACRVFDRIEQGGMYTNPDFARRGVGRTILGLCEATAKAEGFSRVELAEILAGEPLYRACGYEPIEHFRSDTPQGLRIPLIRMGKPL